MSQILSGYMQKRKREQGLSLELLEDRMMLSTVEIFAAGATGQENLELFIDGQFEQTFFNVGGDASTRQFQRIVFESDQNLTPGNIGIGFATDAFDPSIGLDRDLIIDRIVVDGVTVEAEDETTFSTGVFRDGGLTGAGFFETEVLNINGVLTFADPVSTGSDSGDRIEFDATGSTGEELVNLLVDGEVVQTFGLFNSNVTFVFESDDPNVSIEDVRLEFVNDLFDPDRGIDRNVLISEFRVIDGDTGAIQSARTSDSNVLSSGIFVDGRITQGQGAGGFIVGNFDGNGFVEISGGGSTSGDRIEFDAIGTTGEELVNLLVDGEVVQTFGLFESNVTFTFDSADPNISIEDIRLEFVNDLFDADRGIDRNVQIFEYRVIDGDTRQVQTARTSDSNVLSSGIFADGAITQGFGAGGFIAGNFNGNGFVEISDSGGATLTPDPSFQVTDVFAGRIAVGPGDQVATVENSFSGGPADSPLVRIFGSDGLPLSSFGDNGQVDVGDLLGSQVEIEGSRLAVLDLEFFDDGSLVLVGTIQPNDALFFEPREPVILKLNPDGTLDESFTQQGILTGTSLQLAGFTSSTELKVAIDPQDRVVVFGISNDSGGFSTTVNFVVSRLQADGSIDSSFGDNGSVFIPSFEEGGFGASQTEPINLEVDDQGEITFGARFLQEVGTAAAIGRLLVDGSFDSGFGDNGVAIVGGFASSNPIEFELLPSGVTVVSGDSNEFPFPEVTLLTPDGDVFSELVLDTETEFGILDGSSANLLIDPSGNALVRSNAGIFDRVAVLQRILPSGELDTEFGVDGIAVVRDLDAANPIVTFDSQGRLISGGKDLTRFVV